MNTKRVPPDGTHLIEDALYCAIRLIAAMDESVGHGNAIVIPEVIIRAITQSIPSGEANSFGELSRLLSHYCTLRNVAEEEREKRYWDGVGAGDDWGDDHGYLTPENTLHTLTSGKWDCPDPEVKHTIARVLQTVVERNERNIWAGNRFPIEHSRFPSPARCGFKSESSETLDRESETILSTALNHGFFQLIACDDGYDSEFWEKVSSFTISDWLESDLPEIANEIEVRSLTATYFSGISAFVLRMCEIEAIYRRIGYPVCFYLLRTRDEEPLSFLEYYVRAAGAAEHEIADRTALLWEMLKRRNFRNYKRRLYFSDASGTLVDFVRASPNSFSTCYVVESTSLPQCYRSVSDERHALVVHLPEHRLEHLEELTRWDGLKRFFREDESSGRGALSLSISHVFCCNFDDLWPVMSLFRRSVPVVYILEKQSIFVLHDFHHFTDGRHLIDTPLRYTPTTYISTDDRNAGTAPAHVMTEGRFHRAPLSVLSSVTKLTKSPGRLLKKALLEEHPEAGISPQQHAINRLLGLESDPPADSANSR